MSSRLCGPSIAVLAVLGSAAVCLAAEPGYQAGKGGVGGQIGASTFRLDRAFGSDWFGDYSDGAQPRFSFAGHWRYAMAPWLRWQLSPGLTWSAYKERQPAPFTDPNFPTDRDKTDYLTLMVPITAQLQVTMRSGSWIYYAGAGPGVYRVWVQNQRKVLKDPRTFKLHRGVYPGGSAQLGVERFLKSLPSTSVEWSLGGHLALAQRDEQFPSGFNSNVLAVESRIGVTYYFVPGQPRKTEGTGTGTTPASP